MQSVSTEILKYNERDAVWLIVSSKNCGQFEPALCRLQSATNKLERGTDNRMPHVAPRCLERIQLRTIYITEIFQGFDEKLVEVS